MLPVSTADWHSMSGKYFKEHGLSIHLITKKKKVGKSVLYKQAVTY